MTNRSDKHDSNNNTDTSTSQTDSADVQAHSPADTTDPVSDTTSATAETQPEQPETREAASSQPTTQTTDAQPSVWPGRIALVVALAAIGVSGYLFMQQQQLQQQTVTLSAEIESRLASNASDVARTVATVSEQAASVNQQLGQLKEQTAASQRNIDSLQERLTQSIRQVQAQQMISEKDWLLAEAEYLLRLANQRILMEQSAAGALALLRAADEVLHKADDVALYPGREALAKDISALEAIPRVDTEGVFLRLSALNSQVVNLRMIPVTERHRLPDLLEEITPEAVRETWGAGAREALSGALGKLEQLVIIQHRDEPVEPLLSPEQSYYLQQNLHLMLEQAQHALLQRRQGAYDASLTKAHQWIQDYFEAKDATTQALLQGIAELKQVNVAPEVPSVASSLEALQVHINELRRLKREGGQG